MSVRAHLQLERFRLQSLHIEYNRDWLARETVGPDQMEDYAIEPEFRIFQRSEDDDGQCGADQVMVALSLHGAPVDESHATRFEQIHIEVWGLFSLSEDTPPEQIDQLRLWNAVAILHGIARGQIMQATGTCADGPFVLPSLNYVAAEPSNGPDEPGGDQPECQKQGASDEDADLIDDAE